MRAIALAMILVGAFLAGCAGNDPDTSSTAPTTPPSSTTSQSPPPPPPPSTVTVTATSPPTTVTTTASSSSSSSSSSSTSTGPSDVAAPVVSNLLITVLGPSSIRVNWTVEDESSVTSQVEWAKATEFAVNPQRTVQKNGSGNHSQDLTNLSSCTTYRIRIYAKDIHDHEIVSTPSQDATTTGPSPSVTGISVINIMHDRFTVQWTVSGAPDTQSQVEYGTTTAYGSYTGVQAGPGTKTAVVSGLSTSTNYNFRVMAANPCGGYTGANTVQKTARLLSISIVPPALPGGQATFNPGTGPTNQATVAAGQPIVFEITNSDSVQHNWNIEGASPAYGSGTINAGVTHTMPASISFAAGDHTMKCNIHNMSGVVRAS